MNNFNELRQRISFSKADCSGWCVASGNEAANGIYRTLRSKGYKVFAVNPHMDMVEGDPCYASMQAIPDGVDGAIIITSPLITAQIVEDCVAANVPRVWMHNNTFMPSSVSEEATAVCRANNITVIAGGCPMMFFDPFHKCMKWVLGAMGRLPAANGQ
ncbi:MAG: CoA-binding protein [Anaerolineae bacterium]|nr:CoA-binding protein [Anaerolineae bacterium]